MDEAGNPTPRTAVSLSDPATLVDPYPAYRTLRDTAPVHFEPSFGAWIVTRYDLVREALRDTATYSSEFGDFLAQAQKICLPERAGRSPAEAGGTEQAHDPLAADHAHPGRTPPHAVPVAGLSPRVSARSSRRRSD